MFSKESPEVQLCVLVMETILSAVLWLEQQWGNFGSRMVTGFETTVYVVRSPLKSFFEQMVPWKQPMDFLNDFLKLESFYGRFFRTVRDVPDLKWWQWAFL